MVLGAVTVAALDLILLIGVGGDTPPWFGALVLVMDAALIASSAALGVSFLRRARRMLGALFLGNLAVMLAALVLRVSAVEIPRPALFAADLYWLNLYLVGLAVAAGGSEHPDAEPGAAADAAPRAGPRC